MLKNKKLIIAIILFLFLPTALFVSHEFTYKANVAQADDHEEDEEDEEDEEYEEDRGDEENDDDFVIVPRDSFISDPDEEFIAEPVVTSIPEIVYEEEVIEVPVISDKDHDGIADENDPHPDVAEIYVVIDENRNGIVDEFEQFSENINTNE